MKNIKWSVGFDYVDLVVIRRDPEYADISNPHGNIYAEKFSIIAEDAKGFRKSWGSQYDSPEAAETAYITFAPPVAIWEDIRPAYGSEAYAENWQEYEADLMKIERYEGRS